MIFYDQDEGGAGGGAGGETFASTASEVFDEGTPAEGTEPTETVPSSTGGDGGSGTPTPAASPLTAKEIADAVREGVRPTEPQKEYTQEELDKIFKVWQPDEGLVAKLQAGGAEAVEALKLMREGLAGQFGQLIQYQLQVFKKELEEQYSPALTVAQEIKTEREREAFFKDNEDLREHAVQVDIAYKSLLGEKKTFPTLKEAQKALADRARQLIPNGNGSGATQSGGTRQTTIATKPKPATLSSGSQAGGSGGGSAPPNVFHEIFGQR